MSRVNELKLSAIKKTLLQIPLPPHSNIYFSIRASIIFEFAEDERAGPVILSLGVLLFLLFLLLTLNCAISRESWCVRTWRRLRFRSPPTPPPLRSDNNNEDSNQHQRYHPHHTKQQRQQHLKLQHQQQRKNHRSNDKSPNRQTSRAFLVLDHGECNVNVMGVRHQRRRRRGVRGVS